MVFVACSGFSVPVSRYWGDFKAVEISETELGLPGEGTLRRYVRESPKGFVFTMLAPNALGASGFRKTKENKDLLAATKEVADQLSARAVVFVAPEDFKPTKEAKAALKGFLSILPAGFPTPVLDLPHWKPQQVVAAVGEKRAVVAYDPLLDTAPDATDFVYMRLLGPAGYRSRYDEASLETVAARCRECDAGTLFVVFRNIDRHANAGTVRKLIES